MKHGKTSGRGGWFLLIGLIGLGAAVAARGEILETCGYIRPGPDDCWILSELDPPQATTLLTLPTGAWQPSTIYRVSGDVGACDSLCGGIHWRRCMVVTSVEPCPPDSLGCGILEQTPFGCAIWDSPGHGRLELPDLGGFAASDTVEVVGLIDGVTASTCQVGRAKLRNYTLRHCPTRLVPVQPTSWGRIKAIYR